MCRNILRFGLSRMSREKWGEEFLMLKRMTDGSDAWIVDGQRMSFAWRRRSRRG